MTDVDVVIGLRCYGWYDGYGWCGGNGNNVVGGVVGRRYDVNGGVVRGGAIDDDGVVINVCGYGAIVDGYGKNGDVINVIDGGNSEEVVMIADMKLRDGIDERARGRDDGRK